MMPKVDIETIKVYLNKMSNSHNLIALYQCVMLCIKLRSI